ncbi:MAG TPA: hypothetical protein VKV29_13210 [Chthonomonas sp.]|jgi:hypothetical protein|uniref:hypothetical protein n=1 Tax=Chthonomonas sp. TaxID=2282153 RepID=UPI002B4B36F7|nr:hypothetical protein [Chthonomonas sp.]HLH81226.1 hypothetical protein [Chthonomonas sp.]
MTDKHIEQILMKLQEQLQATQAELQATNTKLEKVQKQHTSTLRRMKVEAGLGLCALIGALWFTPLPQVMAQGYGQTLKQLIAEVTILENHIHRNVCTETMSS